MNRRIRAWYREARGGWFATIGGRQVHLADGAKNRAEAERRLAIELARSGVYQADERLTVGGMLDLYLVAYEDLRGREPARQAAYRLAPARKAFGDRLASSLRPSEARAWLKGLAVRPASVRAYAASLKAAYRWARDEDLTEADPFRGVRVPAAGRRERILSDAERSVLVRDASEEMRRVLVFLMETGARPHIAREITAADVDWKARVATVTSKGRPYQVVLTRAAYSMLAELAIENPDGPLLRNSLGKPWTRGGLVVAFSRHCKRAGIEGVSLYTLRHTFITDGLEKGIPLQIVATLANHRDFKMIGQVYSHLSQKRDTLRRYAEQIGETAAIDLTRPGS